MANQARSWGGSVGTWSDPRGRWPLAQSRWPLAHSRETESPSRIGEGAAKQTWTLAGQFGTLRPSSPERNWSIRKSYLWCSGVAANPPEHNWATLMSRLSRWQDLILPIGIISSVLVILIPMPPSLMDMLLAANITVAVIVLLTTIYVKTPLEFSIFPSLLLATTLGRLVLNVASTRLILR